MKTKTAFAKLARLFIPIGVFLLFLSWWIPTEEPVLYPVLMASPSIGVDRVFRILSMPLPPGISNGVWMGANARTTWILSPDFAQAETHVWRKTNDRDEWQTMGNISTVSFNFCMVFSDDSLNAWIGTAAKLIYRTLDGGVRWLALDSEFVSNCPLFFLDDNRSGWLYAGFGEFKTTIDGGKSWADVPATNTPVGSYVTALFFSDAKHGWVAWSNGRISVTEDGGQSWAVQDTRFPIALRQIYFKADGRTGWAVGDEGIVLATRNGGANWVQIKNIGRQNLRSFFVDTTGSRFFVFDENRYGYISSDSGATWNQISRHTSNWLANRFFDAALCGLLFLSILIVNREKNAYEGSLLSYLRAGTVSYIKLLRRLGSQKKYPAKSGISKSIFLVLVGGLQRGCVIAFRSVQAVSYQSSIHLLDGLIPTTFAIIAVSLLFMPAFQEVFFGMATSTSNQIPWQLLGTYFSIAIFYFLLVSAAGLLATRSFFNNKSKIRVELAAAQPGLFFACIIATLLAVAATEPILFAAPEYSLSHLHDELLGYRGLPIEIERHVRAVMILGALFVWLPFYLLIGRSAPYELKPLAIRSFGLILLFLVLEPSCWSSIQHAADGYFSQRSGESQNLVTPWAMESRTYYWAEACLFLVPLLLLLNAIFQYWSFHRKVTPVRNISWLARRAIILVVCGTIILFALGSSTFSLQRALGPGILTLLAALAYTSIACGITLAVRCLNGGHSLALLLPLFLAFGMLEYFHERPGTESLPEIAGSDAEKPTLAAADRDIVVNAHGGGLRAALYTAQILASLDDSTCGDFGRRLRAMSGVSGGSVGIGVYLVIRQDLVESGGWNDCRPHANLDGPLFRRVHAALAVDHLSPVVAKLLAVDIIPSGRSAVRGQALLDSWQEAVLDAERGLKNARGLAPKLSSLTGGIVPPPVVLFSATDASSGEPVTFSNEDPAGRLSIGQALLNSARFPIVSPAGLWLDASGNKRMLVDGGFFDNSGTVVLSRNLPSNFKGHWIQIDSAAESPTAEDSGWTAGAALLAVHGVYSHLNPQAMADTHPMLHRVDVVDDLDAAFRIELSNSGQLTTAEKSGLYWEYHQWYRQPLTWFLSSTGAAAVDFSIRSQIERTICPEIGCNRITSVQN